MKNKYWNIRTKKFQKEVKLREPDIVVLKTFEIGQRKDRVWTEGDIYETMLDGYGIFTLANYAEKQFPYGGDLSLCRNFGSFFDDPKKWSKFLWNISESKGIEKVLPMVGYYQKVPNKMQRIIRKLIKRIKTLTKYKK
jgi:hypothetical protein